MGIGADSLWAGYQSMHSSRGGFRAREGLRRLIMGSGSCASHAPRACTLRVLGHVH